MNERDLKRLQRDYKIAEDEVIEISRMDVANGYVGPGCPKYIAPMVERHGDPKNGLSLKDPESEYVHYNRVLKAIDLVMKGKEVEETLLNKINAPDYLRKYAKKGDGNE